MIVNFCLHIAIAISMVLYGLFLKKKKKLKQQQQKKSTSWSAHGGHLSAGKS